MEPLFSFKTDYDMNTFASMACALRMTIRKKHSKRSHIFGWGVVVLGIAFIFLGDVRVLHITAIAAIALALIFEDRLNGWIAMKRMLKGMEKAKSDFYEDRYVSATDIGTTEWHYDKIKAVAEDKDYFIFLFSESHTQAYDKRKMTGGTGADFRNFIMQKQDLMCRGYKKYNGINKGDRLRVIFTDIDGKTGQPENIMDVYQVGEDTDIP